jgi:hypothetical protein
MGKIVWAACTAAILNGTDQRMFVSLAGIFGLRKNNILNFPTCKIEINPLKI